MRLIVAWKQGSRSREPLRPMLLRRQPAGRRRPSKHAPTPLQPLAFSVPAQTASLGCWNELKEFAGLLDAGAERLALGGHRG